jgi:hypothetical protein
LRTSSLCSVLHNSVSLTPIKALLKAEQVAEAQNKCPFPVHNCFLLVITPTPPATPSPAVTGMPIAPTHPAPWPGLQATLPPAQSDLLLKDVSVIQVLAPRQAASIDPARGPSWMLLAPDVLQVHAQAGTASSNGIGQESLDSFKAAVQTASNGMVSHADTAEPVSLTIKSACNLVPGLALPQSLTMSRL